MATLQLPTRAPAAPRFTRAQIADMAHGAKEVRERSARQGQLPRAVARLIEKIDAAAAARKDCRDTEDAMGDAGRFDFFVDIAIFGRTLFHGHKNISSLDEIDRAEKRQRSYIRQENAHHRAWLRRHPKDALAYEVRQSLAANLERWPLIPKEAKRLRTAMRKHLAKVNGVRRRHHILSKQRKEGDALRAMSVAYETVRLLPVNTLDDAIALVTAAEFIGRSHMLWNGASPELLQRATIALQALRAAQQ
jgi:hypothetical protein